MSHRIILLRSSAGVFQVYFHVRTPEGFSLSFESICFGLALNGYIDVGDRCWRRNVLLTDIGDGFRHFGYAQLSFDIIVGH